ncbi:MAG: hypothetical protein R2798_02675 [Chitinophagales bacterium]
MKKIITIVLLLPVWLWGQKVIITQLEQLSNTTENNEIVVTTD